MKEIESNKFQKLYTWLLLQKISFLFYILAITLLIFSENNKTNYILSISLFASAFIYDTVSFFKYSHNKHWEKFIYIVLSIVGYFSYIQAEAMAKGSIYTSTGIKPELLETALAYFKGIYFIPAVILTSSFALAIIMFILLMFSMVSTLLEMLQINNEPIKFIQKKYFHIFLYFISVSILFIAFFKDNTKLYESFLGKNYIATGIIKYSFVPNNFCNNIPKGTYIKLLDSNDVSVSNITQLQWFSIPDDINVTFNMEKCIKEDN